MNKSDAVFTKNIKDLFLRNSVYLIIVLYVIQMLVAFLIDYRYNVRMFGIIPSHWIPEGMAFYFLGWWISEVNLKKRNKYTLLTITVLAVYLQGLNISNIFNQPWVFIILWNTLIVYFPLMLIAGFLCQKLKSKS